MKEFDGIKLNSIVPDEGTLFIFDICITDDPGGFHSHLADSKELNASAAIHQIVDEVVKNLGEKSNSPSRKRASSKSPEFARFSIICSRLRIQGRTTEQLFFL
jgi:hypothetical protein